MYFARALEGQMHVSTEGVTQHPPLAEPSRPWAGDVSETAPCGVGRDGVVSKQA